MRRAWFELMVGVTLLAVAAGLFLYSRSTAARAMKSDRQTLVAKLRSDVAKATSRAQLTAEEKSELLNARKRLRQAIEARNAGKPFDEKCASEASGTIRRIMDQRVFSAGDRQEIDRTVAALRELEKQEQARRRRANFVAQLGIPLGLLADLAVQAM